MLLLEAVDLMLRFLHLVEHRLDFGIFIIILMPFGVKLTHHLAPCRCCDHSHSFFAFDLIDEVISLIDKLEVVTFILLHLGNRVLFFTSVLLALLCFGSKHPG